MIAYPYKCEKCGEISDVYMEMNADHPKILICKSCGGNTYRYFGSLKVHIPENFQAANELYNGDSAANFDYISNRMKHGTRFSGKDKVYY